MNNLCTSSVLIVEDCEDLRELEASLLESSGYIVNCASNGKEALELLEKIDRPCLVLLDLMMPVMNGHQFLNEVKNNQKLAPIPILIVSAVADQKDTSGAVDFVKKPFDVNHLLGKVSQYCA